MTSRRLRLPAAIVTAVCLLSPIASAQSITLRLADSLPTSHIIHQVVTQPFMDAVEKESGGKVSFQFFPGEQLGKAKDLLSLTQAGMADIGYVVPAYASDKMPLSAALELPGIFTNYCQGVKAFYALTREGGFLEKNEFTPNNMVPLVTFLLPPYQILFGTGKSIESLKDIEGLKTRSAGGAMDFMLKSMNLVPVRMTPPEVYESLSRGTIDAVVFPYMSAESYGVANLLKSGTAQLNFGTVALTYSISKAKWKQLPEATRALLERVGKNVTFASCDAFLKIEDESLARVEARGVKRVQFSGADMAVLDSVFDRVGGDWAKALDDRGKPGSAALAATRKAIAESK